MKRLILLLICALYVTTAAQAQISFYGEWCRKGSGEKTIMICDMKEKKGYVMNEARKTCMVMEEINFGVNSTKYNTCIKSYLSNNNISYTMNYSAKVNYNNT